MAAKPSPAEPSSKSRLRHLLWLIPRAVPAGLGLAAGGGSQALRIG